MTDELSEIRDSHLRSVLKAFTWRVVATATTAVIALLVTGRMDLALTIGGLEFFVKIFAFYIHERAWQVVPLGTIRSVYRWFVPPKQPRRSP